MSDHNEPLSVGKAGDSKDYFAQRELKKGAVGWLLLVGLGVAYVISGDFAGWNFGIAQGGWGGMFVAVVLAAIMYLCICLSMSEMSTMMPTAGGGYSFARMAFGPFGGYLTGTAILIEYAIAPAAIATFIGAYCESLFGIGGWIIYLICYLVFMGLHLKGAGEALKIMFVITAIAVVAVVVFLMAMVPHFNSANLFDIAVDSSKVGASSFLPQGYLGIWAAVPYAIWFFLAVEGVPLAAEEAKNPAQSLPRGLIGAMLILAAFAILILILSAGAAGASVLKDSGAPLVDALVKVYGHGWLANFVNFVGLAGLIASFFSIIYAYSRQIFALSRAGYLPTLLSLTNKNKSPYLAVIIPGIIGFLLSLTKQGDLLILIAVFGATISYVLMMMAHIKLRISQPDVYRPYRTPGGIVTSSIALILSVVAVVAGFLVDPKVWFIALGIYVVFILYFLVYSRHHLISGTPEEEFASIKAAEQEL